MTATPLSVSLTRAHKVAERLKAQASLLLQEASTAAGASRLTGVSPGQLERLRHQGEAVEQALAQAQRYLRAAAYVRIVIGRENEARSISAKLARMDAVKSLVNAIKLLLSNARGGALELGEIADYKPLSSDNSSYSLPSVNVVSVAARERIQADLLALQREAVLLSDEIAEANAARVLLELDDDLAAFATGAP